MADKIIFGLGFWITIIGFAGLASACEGNGSFAVSAAMLAVGLGCSMYEMRKGSEWED